MWLFKARDWKYRCRKRIEVLRVEEAMQMTFRDTLSDNSYAKLTCDAALKAIRASRVELENFLKDN